jgi:NAD(P)H-dependent FMN reductase
MRILAISGSLRAASSNSRVVAALPLVAPPGMEVVVATGLGDLPHFNPDLDIDPPPTAVAAFREQILATDGFIVCSPEYAHGVAGVMKNGLDWLVSVIGIYEKRPAILNSAARAHHAVAHMRDNLNVMTCGVVEAASITLAQVEADMTPEEIAVDPKFAGPLADALDALADAIRADRA